jgi:GAF domain-containing protein
MAAVGLATGSLTACSEAICSHACRLLGCDDACLFVATCEPTDVGTKGHEVLYRLASPSPTYEEVQACDVEILCAAGCAVPTDCLARACLETPSTVLRVPRGHEDSRYDAAADRVPGKPPPASLLYLDLSDTSGPLRAVLRLSHHPGRQTAATAAHEAGSPEAASFTIQCERTLLALRPVFALSLRHPLRDAAAEVDPERAGRAKRAAVARSLSECIAALPDAAMVGDIGGVTEAFSRRIASLLGAEACVIHIFDAAANSLMAYPANIEREPSEISLDGHAGEALHHGGITALAACTKRAYAVGDATKDKRINQAHDRALEGDGVTRCILVTPFDSAGTGELVGVCAVINKERRGGFTEEDEELLYPILKLVSLAIENHMTRQECKQLQAMHRRASIKPAR